MHIDCSLSVYRPIPCGISISCVFASSLSDTRKYGEQWARLSNCLLDSLDTTLITWKWKGKGKGLRWKPVFIYFLGYFLLLVKLDTKEEEIYLNQGARCKLGLFYLEAEITWQELLLSKRYKNTLKRKAFKI